MTEPRKPSGENLGFVLPALLNLLVMSVLYGIELAKAGAAYRAEEIALGKFFFDLLGLLLADGVVLVVLLFVRPKWAAGFALAGVLVVLIGLGTCGYNLSHMHVNGANYSLPSPWRV